MKRLRVILLFLLLGAVVNVGVAWGCTSFGNARSHSDYTPTRRDQQTLNRAGEDYDSSLAFRETGLGIEVVIIPLNDDEYWKRIEELRKHFILDWFEADYPHPHYAKYRFGFPFCSLEYVSWFHSSEWIRANKKQDATNKLWGWVIDENDNTLLPLKPMWFAFGFDSIFWAATAWTFICGPFVLRRFFRHKRGLCVKCAYDLRGAEHEACPECGEQVAHPSPN